VVVFEDQLIRKLKVQDPNAFNVFYLQTVDMFFRYLTAHYNISKADAEDIISDFYVKFWEAIKHFDEKLSFS
jgi:DNA-directed RNA polymerase specialized sigma24 family protein